MRHLITALVLMLSAPATGQSPELRILAPLAEDLVAGEMTIVAAVEPESAAVSQMVFSVDGVVACRLTAPPFQCDWKGANQLREHVVRVVATLATGERLTKGMSTASAAFVDTSVVDSVLVSVNVRDRRGRPVMGLTRDKFRLLDNGRPREITHFGTESVSCDVLLALDASGSMYDSRADIRAAALAMIDALRPQDRVSIAGFNTSLFTISPRGATRAQHAEALQKLAPSGGTAVNDAILAAVRTLGPSEGRRALVIFTDGDDRASQTSDESLERRLLADNIILYAVGQGRAADVEAFRTRMQRLALGTGGRAFFFGGIESASETFREIVRDLTTQYTIGFDPEPARPGEGPRKLSVEVSPGNYRIKARESYVPRSATR
jgi:VWFA-related protein